MAPTLWQTPPSTMKWNRRSSVLLCTLSRTTIFELHNSTLLDEKTPEIKGKAYLFLLKPRWGLISHHEIVLIPDYLNASLPWDPSDPPNLSIGILSGMVNFTMNGSFSPPWSFLPVSVLGLSDDAVDILARGVGVADAAVPMLSSSSSSSSGSVRTNFLDFATLAFDVAICGAWKWRGG